MLIAGYLFSFMEVKKRWGIKFDSGRFLEDENGDMYMDYEVGIYIIS